MLTKRVGREIAQRPPTAQIECLSLLEEIVADKISRKRTETGVELDGTEKKLTIARNKMTSLNTRLDRRHKPV
jgi:hypothetical protein